MNGEDLICSWKKPNQDWQIWFCECCGSQLPGKNDDLTLFDPAGLLSDENELEVLHHIWVNSKASWDERRRRWQTTS